jgi:aspartate 1-decarboxylase
VSPTLETVLKGKLHRLVVTETDFEYEGSIDVGAELMKAAGIRPYERVLVANFTNGQRWWTYAVPWRRGRVRLNGGSARMGLEGDIVTVFAWAQVEAGEEFHPKVVLVGEGNAIKSVEAR